MKDLKIINGSVPFFETNSWETVDILIHNGVIEKIGTVEEETKETIDAEGKIVAPGFIDIHGHEDPLVTGKYQFFTGLCALRMGVTTQAIGNCGDNYADPMDFYQFICENGSPINYMTFIGQNWLRQQAGGTDRYIPSTAAQLSKMKKLLSERKNCKPVGLSCGFEYAPGVTTEETISLLEAFEEEGYLTSVHFRSDGADSIASIDELIEIQRKSGYAMQMSHIGSCSATGYMKQALAHINHARENGVDIMSDCYPYNAFCTGIGTAVFDEGCFEKWNKSYDSVLLTGGKYKNQWCTKELFDEVRREDPDLHVVAFVMNEEEIALAYQDPYVMIGSDCGFYEGCGHPRGAGTFPRVLGRYVREKKVLPLMEALRKMTLLPADRLNLYTKGEIKEGFDADIVIFDKERIRDCATFEEPTLAPEGIHYVLVNGKIAVQNGIILNDRLGRYVPYENRIERVYKRGCRTVD